MNISSADLFGIGFNEIDSFNKTLNEMLQVWNHPIDQQQQHSQQQQQQQEMSNILNMTSRGLPRFNLLNTSSSGLKDINLSASTNSLIIPDIFMGDNQQQQQQQQTPKLNGSSKGFDFITKTINEISNEQKQYQPYEIIPIKNINNNNNNNNNNINNSNNSSSSNSNNSNNSGVTEFGVLNTTSFSLDPNKIEELRLNPSVLDPFLTLPYNSNNNNNINSNNSTTINNNNNFQKKSTINTLNNNNNNNNNNIISGSTVVSGPIRNTFNGNDKAESGSPSTFGLNKEELNSITSSEMNTYVKQASIAKDLTPTEKKELKRQKRLIKNRESAHLSRQRKRERLTDLEHRVEELTTNSADINKTLSSLENENLILKAEVSQLFEVINDSPVLSALFYTIYSQTHQPQQQQKESIETY